MLRFLYGPILKRLEALEENERLKADAVDQKYHWVRKSAQFHNIAIDDILRRLEALEESERLVEDKLRKHVKVCVMLISDSIADNIYLVNKRLNALEDKETNSSPEESKQVYNIGDVVKDGVNTKTYQGNNVWLMVVDHEGQENSDKLKAMLQENGITVEELYAKIQKAKDGFAERWRSIGACVDKPEGENSGE